MSSIARRRQLRLPNEVIRREVLDGAAKVRLEFGFNAEEQSQHENWVRLELEAQGLGEALVAVR